MLILLLMALVCCSMGVQVENVPPRIQYPMSPFGEYYILAPAPVLAYLNTRANNYQGRQGLLNSPFGLGNLVSNLYRKKEEKEERCGHTYCGPNSHCEYNPLVRSKACECDPGYILDPDSALISCISPCSVRNACGSNTICHNDDGLRVCTCKSGFFPASVGSESTTVGCTNPCINSPCNQGNTVCIPLTGTSHHCACQSGFLPIRDNPQINGCHPVCGTALNAVYITQEDYCLELFNFFDNFVTYEMAEDTCERYGGQLAVFDEGDTTFGATLIEYFPQVQNDPNGLGNPLNLNDLWVGGGAGRVVEVPITSTTIVYGDRTETQKRGYICQYNV